MEKPFLPFLSPTLVLQAAIQPLPNTFLGYISIIQLIKNTIIHIKAILYGNKIILYVNKIILYVNKIILYGNKTVLYGNKIVLYVHKIAKLSYHTVLMLQISPAINVSYLL